MWSSYSIDRAISTARFCKNLKEVTATFTKINSSGCMREKLRYLETGKTRYTRVHNLKDSCIDYMLYVCGTRAVSSILTRCKEEILLKF